MTVRYARAPSESFLALFQDGALLHALTEPLACMVGGQPVWLDLQFRKSDEAMLYCGQTRLLTVTMRQANVRIDAHQTYRKQSASAHIRGSWPFATPGAAFSQGLRAYLEQIEVAPRWTRSEGAVQSRWMRNDPAIKADLPWKSIDREAVLTYVGDAVSSASPTAVQMQKANSAVSLLASSEAWSQPSIRDEANELDQIAISNDGQQLVLIELKPRDGKQAFYAPLQLARYALEWATALTDPDRGTTVADVNAVARAQRKIGLGRATSDLSSTPTVRPIIGFNDPPTREVLRRISLVWATIAKLVAHSLILPPEVWAWPDGDQPRKLLSLNRHLTEGKKNPP